MLAPLIWRGVGGEVIKSSDNLHYAKINIIFQNLLKENPLNNELIGQIYYYHNFYLQY